MKHSVIAVAALGAVLTWFLYAAARDNTGVKAAAAVTAVSGTDGQHGEGELAELSQEVARLKAELSATKQRIAGDEAMEARAAEAPAEVDDGEPTPAEVEHMTPEEVTAYEREHSQKVAADADARLAGEMRDAAWSSPVEQQIASSMQELSLSGAHLASAECRQSICRAVIDHDGPETARKLGPALVEHAPFNQMGTYFHYEDRRVVVYAVRPGYE